MSNRNYDVTSLGELLIDFAAKYEFYGSPAALYSKHTAEELGITQGGLNNYFCTLPKNTYKVYRNSKCEIVKGIIITNQNNK